MWAIASAVPHFGWSNGEGAIKGAALAVLVAGLLDRPLPDRLPGWATDWIWSNPQKVRRRSQKYTPGGVSFLNWDTEIPSTVKSADAMPSRFAPGRLSTHAASLDGLT
ncbi:hypothetical protein [Bradyrhizobium sp. USDA 4506]